MKALSEGTRDAVAELAALLSQILISGIGDGPGTGDLSTSGEFIGNT